MALTKRTVNIGYAISGLLIAFTAVTVSGQGTTAISTTPHSNLATQTPDSLKHKTVTSELVECLPKDYQHINGNEGSVLVKEGTKSCGFSAQDGTNFLGIKTNNLIMSPDDKIVVSALGENKSITLAGPFAPGYLLFGYNEPKVELYFNNSTTYSMLIQFVQNITQVPIDCNIKDELSVIPVDINNITALFVKSIPDPTHVQIMSSAGASGHYLIQNTIGKKVDFDSKSSTPLIIKTSPALTECSKEYSDDGEFSHELSGPATVKNGGYSCVNLFKSSINSEQAHYDADFANFITLANSNDELVIDDGSTVLKLVSSSASDYKKRVVSFSGNNLAVIYNSPGPFEPTNVPFKLTVRSKVAGGVVKEDKDLTIPANGIVSYTLIPKTGKFASLEMTGLQDVNLIIQDDTNKQIILDDKVIMPPFIKANQRDKKLYITISTKTKPKGTISFKSTDVDCGGILWESSGSISASGVIQKCSWLLGSQNSILDVNYNNLVPNGCLLIRSLAQKDPIYKRCDVGQDEVLPQFSLNQAYISLELGSKDTQFQASVTQPVLSTIDVVKGLQRNLTSIGYPAYYMWSSQSDSITIDGNNKNLVVSVADLDLRAGEKLLIDNTEVSDLLSLKDFDVINKSCSVIVKRSTATSDFSSHRGFKIVSSEYQKIMVANMTTDALVIPKNLNSVLVKLYADKRKRFSYKIVSSTPEQDYKMAVVDSRSLLGRQVYMDEKFNGFSTSDTLLVSIIANKKDATIPELVIQYKQLACNTTDHICDSSSRCVPEEKLCKGLSYCKDGSDTRVPCSNGPAPLPNIIEMGVGGFTVFVLCVLMFTFGVIGTLYGPDLYKSIESRLRSGHYTTFSSTE